MNKLLPKSRLGEVVVDLTESRTFSVKPNDIIIDPTITSATHKISIAAINHGYEIKIKKRVRIEPGDLVFSRLHTQNGAFAFSDSFFQSTNTFIPLKINEDKADRRFLYWAMRQFVPSLSASDTVGRETYKTADILRLEIPLPPLAEQRRIVIRIEELAAQINEACTLRQQAIEEAAAFPSAARGKLFYAIARQFSANRLEELTTRITKGESPEWQGFSYQDSGPLFIRSENVLWGSLSLRDAVHIPEAFHQKLLRSQLHFGDVLINLVGASIGRICSVPENIGEANVNQAVAVISPLKDKLIPEYLVQFLLSPVAQDKIHGGKVETARPNISLGNLRGLEIPIPPLPEQRRIVAELDALQAEVDALKRLQAETAAELDALLPSILDRAFKGEI